MTPALSFLARLSLGLCVLVFAACSSVRWPWAGRSSCEPPCSAPSAAAKEPPPVPPPMAPCEPPPSELGPVVPPPSDPGAAACPPLAPMPAGPRPLWSAAADPDLSSLPADVAVEGARAWSVIVVHHSATARGGAALFDRMHKERGWEGVGYDFVIGNGTDTRDGEIEVTFRWREQKDGAHAKGWNDVGIGICLVGNFENTDPTPAQRESLTHLLRHLRRRFGVPPQRIVGHGSINPTLCPGKRFRLAEFVAASAP